jgi:hypothetical protein
VRSPLIAVQPPTKLKFRQNPETPELLNKYIFYDTDITPEGKEHYYPGLSTVRYGTLLICVTQIQANAMVLECNCAYLSNCLGKSNLLNSKYFGMTSICREVPRKLHNLNLSLLA